MVINGPPSGPPAAPWKGGSVRLLWVFPTVSVCPSTAFQSALAFDGSDFRAARDEPPGYQLHYWDGPTLATHTVAVRG